jgi:hypothetical protein
MLLPRMSLPSCARTRGRALLPALAFVLAACGGPEEPGQPAPPAPKAAPARWKLEMPTPAEQARFALERLLTGPVPQDALPLGRDQHQQVMRLAQRDLAALPGETRHLLEDPALVERVAGPQVHRNNLNPWDNVLSVLLTLPDKPAALVIRWTEPALARDVAAIRLKAIDNLTGVADPAVGALLLAFLEGAEEPEISRTAWGALSTQPAPWPARGLEHVRRRGSPNLWLDVAPLLELRFAAGGSEVEDENLLAWWALLSEPGGPRASVGLPRVKGLPWSSALPATFATWGPRVLPGDPSGRRIAGPWPEARSLDLKWLAVAPEDSPVRTANELTVSGVTPSVEARCVLARRGKAIYVAAVEADKASALEERALLARHCLMGPDTSPSGNLAAFWDQMLAALAKQRGSEGGEPRQSEVQALAKQLPGGADEEGRRILGRILRELRPMRSYRLLIERAYDALARAGLGLEEALLRELLAHPDPEERGVALHLVQRGRVVALLPEVERVLADASPAERLAVRRVLIWIHAGGGTEPRQLEAFVRRYAGWVEETDDERAGGLATGLLDLGDPGAAAFVAGLRGPRFRVFLSALGPAYLGVLPVEVAEGLADRVDASLPPELRRAALVALWRSAPADAAPAIAAIKSRLDPADRRAVDVVVEMVSHRAARR